MGSADVDTERESAGLACDDTGHQQPHQALQGQEDLVLTLNADGLPAAINDISPLPKVYCRCS